MALSDNRLSNDSERILNSFTPRELAFPTDRLTVRDLINQFPNDLKWEWNGFVSEEKQQFVEALFGALHTEREIAAMAFCKAANIPFPRKNSLNEQGLAEILSSAYESLGISTGQHQTNELIRSIEVQAASLIKGSHTCG